MARPIDNVDDDVGYSTLGLRLASADCVGGIGVRPRLSVAWQHAFGDVTPVEALTFLSTGTGFSVAGVPIAQDSALIDAGLRLAFDSAALEILYSGQFAADARDNAVNGRVNWRFKCATRPSDTRSLSTSSG